jgi:hypothetical protein
MIENIVSYTPNVYRNKILDKFFLIISLSIIFGIIFFIFNRNFSQSIVFSLFGVPSFFILHQQILRIAFLVSNKFNLYKFIWRLIAFLLANIWLFIFLNEIFNFIPNNFISYFSDYDTNLNYSDYFKQLFSWGFAMLLITSSIGFSIRLINRRLLKIKTKMIR